MEITALILYSLWVLGAFVARSYVQFRRTGDIGVRLAARPNTAPWWAKVAFLVALILGFAAPIAAIVGAEGPRFSQSPALQFVGVVLTACGIVLTVVVQEAMGASWRVGVDPEELTELVTNGPFSVSRDPIFGAMAVTAVGLAMIIPSTLSVLALVALGVAIATQIRLVEEPYLRSVHGEAYWRYCDEVGRLLPIHRRRSRKALIADD